MATETPQQQRVKRLRRLRVEEVSVVARPANQHADILITKQDVMHERVARLEASITKRIGPERLLARAHEVAGAMRARMTGEVPGPSLPASVTKGASGGARLVQRAAELRKQMLAGQEAQHAPQSAPVEKKNLSPAERLVQAARERAAAMRKAAG